MSKSTMENIPLPALFSHTKKIHSMASESTIDQETLKEGINAFQHCDEMVSKLGLFSLNESKDDVSTTNLKYLLLPFYLGELTEKISQDDRIQVIKASQNYLKEFISTCEELVIVSKEEIESSTQDSSDTAAAQRAIKIARFKRQKAAEARLQEIKERKERCKRSLRAAALSSPVKDGEDDELDDEGEEEREAWLTTISLSICKACDLLEMLKKEEEMLLAVKEKLSPEGGNELARELLDERAKRAESWHKNAASRAPYMKPVPPITCSTFAQDVIEGRANVADAHDHKHQPLIFGPASLIGGSLTSERERIAAQVFQPSYRMPWMSIEDAGLQEMKMMNDWQERNMRLMQEANSSWHKDDTTKKDSDDEDESDDAAQENEKARAWDDWKDDNPHGAGNKKLTPCG